MRLSKKMFIKKVNEEVDSDTLSKTKSEIEDINQEIQSMNDELNDGPISAFLKKDDELTENVNKNRKVIKKIKIKDIK